MNETPTQEGQIVFDWEFQIHVAGTWNGWGFSGGGTLHKCKNTGAIRETIYGKNGKTWFYPSEKAREEFNDENELREFLANNNV